jgi:hypothetical protein
LGRSRVTWTIGSAARLLNAECPDDRRASDARSAGLLGEAARHALDGVLQVLDLGVVFILN